MPLPKGVSSGMGEAECGVSRERSKASGECMQQGRRCLLWAAEASILLLFCLGVGMLVEFVVVHPRPPACDVVSLNVTQFSAAPYTSSLIWPGTDPKLNGSDHGPSTPIQLLTAVIVIVLRARNEIERIGTFYDHVHVRVLYNGDVVGEGMVGPFFQARKICNLLQTQVEAHKLPVRHATGKQLLTDMTDHVVDFQVKVHVLTRVSLLKYFTHHFRVHVWCDITVLIVLGGNSSSLVSKQCQSND